MSNYRENFDNRCDFDNRNELIGSRCDFFDNRCDCEPRNNIREYVNKATIEVRCGNKKHYLTSNEVETRKLDVKIRKFVDKTCVVKDEDITYTIIIDNDSGMDLKNIVFFDRLPRGLAYINGSFKVNGEFKTPRINNYELIYEIDEVKKDRCTEITFKEKVL